MSEQVLRASRELRAGGGARVRRGGAARHRRPAGGGGVGPAGAAFDPSQHPLALAPGPARDGERRPGDPTEAHAPAELFCGAKF